MWKAQYSIVEDLYGHYVIPARNFFQIFRSRALELLENLEFFYIRYQLSPTSNKEIFLQNLERNIS